MRADSLRFALHVLQEDYTALCIAAGSGYLEVVMALLNRGALIEPRTRVRGPWRRRGWGVVAVICVWGGSAPRCQTLLTLTPAAAAPQSMLTPLHCAAMQSHTAIVTALLDWGADVNAEDKVRVRCAEGGRRVQTG